MISMILRPLLCQIHYIKAGAKIQDTALALQQNVKTAVQSMTGKPVTRINVHVDGVAADENNA